MTDPLPEIRARRAVMPSEPLEIHITPTEEEYYMQWRIIEYGPPDQYGDRERLAFLSEGDAGPAEFIAHAPTDIDTLIGEVERLRAKHEAIYRRSNAVFESKDAEIERLRGLLGRLEWAGRDGLWPSCPACNGHQRDGHVGIGPDREPCWLAAALRPTDDPPEGERP